MPSTNSQFPELQPISGLDLPYSPFAHVRVAMKATAPLYPSNLNVTVGFDTDEPMRKIGVCAKLMSTITKQTQSVLAWILKPRKGM